MKAKLLLLSLLLTGIFGTWLYRTLPPCDLYGGRMAPGFVEHSCHCTGFKIYRSKDAPADGITENFCLGLRNDPKTKFQTPPKGNTSE